MPLLQYIKTTVLQSGISGLTGRAGSVSWALRLRPRWEDGGGMTDSSSVVLLPSTAEVCRTLASSMMVWSGKEIGKLYELEKQGADGAARTDGVQGKRLNLTPANK